MTENIYSKISDKLKTITERIATSHKRKYEERKTQSEYWTKLEKDANDWRSLIADNRYVGAERFLQESLTKLNEQLRYTLSGNVPNYTREERADKAAIIAGQITILEYLINEPQRVIDLLKGKDNG